MLILVFYVYSASEASYAITYKVSVYFVVQNKQLVSFFFIFPSVGIYHCTESVGLRTASSSLGSLVFC